MIQYGAKTVTTALLPLAMFAASANADPSVAQSVSYLSADDQQQFELSRFTSNARNGVDSNNQSVRLGMHRQYSDLSFAFSTSRSDTDNRIDTGFGIGNLSLNYFSGSGEGYNKLENTLDSMNPWFFHGGNLHPFNYNGYSGEYALTNQTRLQIAQADIFASGLERRTSRYAGIARDRFRAGGFSVHRDSDLAARGVDLSISQGPGDWTVQQFNHESGGRYRSIGFQLTDQKNRWYEFKLDSGRNPLFADDNETRLMFRFGGNFGRSPVMHASESTESSDTSAKPKRRGGLVVLGSLVVAAGVAGSSGSDNQDTGPRFATDDRAALNILNTINPVSVRQNREHGGWVYRNGNGTFGFTSPVAGNVDSVNIGSPATSVPRGTRAVASYHTHGGPDPRFDNENFSPTDLLADNLDRVNGYLGTPAGFAKKHIFATQQIIIIGRINN